MPTQIQIRGNVTATQEARTLASRELDIDTTLKRLNIHDGSTTGGIPHANYVDVQNNRFNYSTATGTNALTATLDPAPSAYVAGQSFLIKAQNTNTASTTINFNSLGAKTIKIPGNGALVALSGGEIVQDCMYWLHYNGTDFVIESAGGGGAMELVETQTVVSSVASVEFLNVIESGYKYVLYYDGVDSSGGLQQYICLQFSNDGGSTWHTQADHNSTDMANAGAVGSGFRFFILKYSVAGNVFIANGKVEFYNLQNSSKICGYIYSEDELSYHVVDDASFRQANSIRIGAYKGADTNPTGTIDTGTFSLYRIIE